MKKLLIALLVLPCSFSAMGQSEAQLKKAQKLFASAVDAYQNQKDYPSALRYAEAVLDILPNDTSILMNAGVFFAPAAEENEKAILYCRRYLDAGGKSVDPYIMMFGIYRDKQKDLDKALVVALEAMAKFPNDRNFPKYELDIYIKQNKLPEAKAAMEKQATADRTDKESRYFLGVICVELEEFSCAIYWLEDALRIDPNYADAQKLLLETQERVDKVAKSSVSVQCSGTTQEGDRCKRVTTNTNGRCYQH